MNLLGKTFKAEYWGKHVGLLYNQRIAQVTFVNALQGIEKARNDRFFMMPCNLDWSSANSRRFSVSPEHGKCIRFIASSLGDIFLVFVTNPADEYSWYMLQISSYGVAFYRVLYYSHFIRHDQIYNFKNSTFI